MQIREVSNATYGWGESLVWDERADRLVWVDCMARTLHWLDAWSFEVCSMRLSSMPTGVVPTEEGRLLVVLDDGLHIVNPDAGSAMFLAENPPGLDGRCNDACADPDGGVITGQLNIGPAAGSLWRWSVDRGWAQLDDRISNTNGPAVADLDGRTTLLVGDTSADYYAYDYDAAAGAVGERRVFGSVEELEGRPDGATVDEDGGYWCALVGGGQLARFTSAGLDTTIALPVPNPTDVTFGGADLDRLYVTAIDGPLLVIDGLGIRGRPEPRCRAT